MTSRPWSTAAVLGAAIFFTAACSNTRTKSPDMQAADKRQKLFTGDWLFSLSDPQSAQAPEFDDKTWRLLALPHDWSIEQPFDANLASGTGYLPGGIAWYRKHFVLPEESRGKIVTIRFDGIYRNSAVYLNGHELGERPYGYSSFEYNLNSYMNPAGQDNVLAVRVDRQQFADSRWYPGSGIYRNVFLQVTDPLHVDRYGTYITTPEVSAASAVVNVDTFVRYDAPAGGDEPETVAGVMTTIYDPSGKELVQQTTNKAVVAGQVGFTHEMIPLPNPMLWSIERPAMYTAITKILRHGQVVDTYRTPFGIRTFKFDPNTGLWLNGQNMKLKGVSLHEDAGAVGSAIPQQVWERRLRILKEAGANAIRCSHNPPAPEFLDLCDRVGFVVMDEAFDEWSGGKKKWIDTWSGKKFSTDGYHSDFTKWSDTDLQDMVLRDRNHPSIVMWSIGNEIDYQNDPFPPNSQELAQIAPRLVKDVKDLDTTRPVTAACASIATNLWYKDLDIVGYNYQEGRYADDHRQNPARVIFGSENGMGLSAWLAVANNPYICSQFLWTGIDYHGEAGRPNQTTAWPERSRPDGFLDLACYAKPMFYFRKSLWNDAPMVKIDANLPQEQPDHSLATPPGLACYTNCASVEFFQNGQSLGEMPLPENRIIAVKADPAAGPIRAVGKNAGKTVVEDTHVPTAPPAKIALREYKTTLGPGDGPNVAQIELSLLDAAGNLARDAGDAVDVTLEGKGRLLGIESGDTNSHENYQAPHHNAFHGRLLLIVETQGPVTVTTTAAGLPPASIQVGK